MFNVKLVQLMEALGRERKHGVGPVGSYGATGGRICDHHQKIFNLIISLTFIIIVICFP